MPSQTSGGHFPNLSCLQSSQHWAHGLWALGRLWAQRTGGHFLPCLQRPCELCQSCKGTRRAESGRPPTWCHTGPPRAL